MRALVVEDDRDVAALIERGLQEALFAVDKAGDGETGLHLACSAQYDVIVLDLMLPKCDGLSVLRAMRGRGITTPVICLTARDAIDDRVRGLNAGADDYLVKPFSFVELLARVRAVLRRGPTQIDNPIVVGDLAVDVIAHTVERAGQKIELTAREFSLLEYLARHAGEVVSRTMILERIWDMNHDPQTNVVDVHINRLRRKVDSNFDAPLIRTVRGTGYVLQAG
ncbi:MAG: response regulator transcription factor [Phycisphaerales bacterium]|nr:response regulator transcription factor [Phycisphaerales bacterium]